MTAKKLTANAKPYVWASWIPKLISGEFQCWWRAWYKAHYSGYEKVAEDATRAEFFETYQKRHDQLTQRAQGRFEAKDGWATRVESEAEFRIEGGSGIVAGKPDLVAFRPSGSKLEAVVVDAKAGRKRSSDHWQVLLYAFALPLSWLKGATMSGAVEYEDGPEDVRPLDAKSQKMIVDAILRVTGSAEPKRSPNPSECRYCELAGCPDRYSVPVGDASKFF